MQEAINALLQVAGLLVMIIVLAVLLFFIALLIHGIIEVYKEKRR